MPKRKPNTNFTPSSNEAIEQIKASTISVVCGRNNCGKSYILKTLQIHFGQNALYLGPQRFSNFDTLGQYVKNEKQKSDQFVNFTQQLNQSNQNLENYRLHLQQQIASLDNDKRAQLINLCSQLLGSQVEIKFMEENNEMSPKYISVDGYNLSYTSSGFRLLMTILCSLFDHEYNVILIDEPELGLSPEIQGILADFIFNLEQKKKYFPHLEKVIVATHSHLFLDRKVITHNFIVEKNNHKIDVKQIMSLSEFNNLQFYLLGNRFESLFLPSVFLLVEGKTDYEYISKVLHSKYPDSLISIIACNSDGLIKQNVHFLKSLFVDFNRSPYKERILTMLDSVHTKGLSKDLESMGIDTSNIIVWDQNGIEFYYPESILAKIFSCDVEDVKKMEINEGNIKLNGIIKSKNDLCREVVLNIDSKTTYNSEFQNKLINRLDSLLY